MERELKRTRNGLVSTGEFRRVIQLHITKYPELHAGNVSAHVAITHLESGIEKKYPELFAGHEIDAYAMLANLIPQERAKRLKR